MKLCEIIGQTRGIGNVHVIHVPLKSAVSVCITIRKVGKWTCLDVAPPVAPVRPRALGEEDVFLRVGGVECVLLTDGACVAVESDTREVARVVVQLCHSYCKNHRDWNWTR